MKLNDVALDPTLVLLNLIYQLGLQDGRAEMMKMIASLHERLEAYEWTRCGVKDGVE